MGGKKREYDDDDGRTIVDMSQVSRPHLYTAPRPQNEFPKSEKKAPRRTVSEDRPWEDTSMTKSERRMYILGALKAVLLPMKLLLLMMEVQIEPQKYLD